MIQNNLLNIIRSDPKFNAHNSSMWFRNKIRELTKKDRISSLDMLGSHFDYQVQKIMPGYMYSFVYDPKTKIKLPYYDKFPLVLPFNKYSDGFIGLNLHYLPYQYRLMLLDRLMTFSKTNKRGEVEYLKFSWQLITATAKSKFIQPCVKRYLSGYVKSRYINIPASDWATAIMLPMENFAKATLKEVWSNV